MFFIKEKLSESVTLKVDITDMNIYTKCSACGKEVRVDMEDVYSYWDYQDDGVYYCDDCLGMGDEKDDEDIPF